MLLKEVTRNSNRKGKNWNLDKRSQANVDRLGGGKKALEDVVGQQILSRPTCPDTEFVFSTAYLFRMEYVFGNVNINFAQTWGLLPILNEMSNLLMYTCQLFRMHLLILISIKLL